MHADLAEDPETWMLKHAETWIRRHGSCQRSWDVGFVQMLRICRYGSCRGSSTFLKHACRGLVDMGSLEDPQPWILQRILRHGSFTSAHLEDPQRWIVQRSWDYTGSWSADLIIKGPGTWILRKCLQRVQRHGSLEKMKHGSCRENARYGSSKRSWDRILHKCL